MERANAGPPASELPLVDDLDRMRERLLRTDPEFFEPVVRHLESVTAVYRVKRAVEARSAREFAPGRRFRTRSGAITE